MLKIFINLPVQLSIFLILGLLGNSACNAQLNGIYTIPGSYPNITSAVNDLNAVGVSGNVTFNIVAGYTENAPVGGIVLQYAGGVAVANQSNAAQTVVFQKNGAGANPLINAFTGTQAANSAVSLDGIFKIVGVDYVTINGVDLSEIGGNVSDPNYMEMGYGLLRTSATNGTQNCSIQNCVITLNNQHTGVWPASLAPLIGSVGIFSGPITNTSTTALVGSTTTGANSNNLFYGNTLQNVSTGIAIKGIADGAPYAGYDLSNIVGSTGISGNTVQNFRYFGVYTVYQNGLSIASNTINNMSGGGSAPTESFYGIYNDNTTNSTSTIAYNTINLTSGVMAVAGTCYAITECAVGTGTANINFNTITLSGGGGLTAFIGINRPTGLSVLANYNVGNNNFRNFNISTTSAAGLATSALILNNNNTIGNQSYTNNYTSGSSAPYIVVSGTNLQSFYGIATTSAAQTSGTLSFLDNSLTNITINNPNGFCYGIYANSGTVAANAINVTVSNCHINNIILVGGNYVGILVAKAHSLATINNNLVENISGANAVSGIQSGTGSNLNMYNNVVRSLTPANLFIGIYSASDAYGTIRNNEIYDCTVIGSAAGGPSYGIRSENVPGGFTINIFENSIYNLSVGGTGIMNLAGISLNSTAAGTAVINIYNNLIADLSLTASAVGNALHGIQCQRGNMKLYFNTIVLGYGTTLTSTAADFNVTGVSYGVAGTGTPGSTTNLDLRNNIIYVSATPNGTGLVSAVRRGSGTNGTPPSNFAGTSNYNIYHAPNTANSYLYSEGTTTANVVNAYNLTNDPRFNYHCSLYKAFMSNLFAPTREDSTYTEVPPFIGAGIPSVKYSLINGSLSYAESGAQILGLVPTDFIAVTRPNNLITNRPDVGFREFTGVKIIPIPPFVLSASSSNNLFCSLPNSTLTGVSTGTTTMVWNGGALINAANPAVVSAAATYEVVATQAVTGCTDTVSVVVTLNPDCGCMVSNGDFQAGDNFWNNGVFTEIDSLSVYTGIPSPPEVVGEVDNSVSLSQVVNGFVVGQLYTLSFDYFARDATCWGSTSTTITISGVVPSYTVTSTTNVFATYSVDFIATSTTHTITFVDATVFLPPNCLDNSGNGDPDAGMIFNNIDICLLSPLPVELISFSGQAKDNFSELSWVTASEQNNDYFILEKSDDVLNWREISRINGAGNSTQILNYSYNDYEISFEIMYYRLIQVDYDGARTTSNTIYVQFDFQDIEIYPNPSNGVFTILSNKKITSIKTVDSYGKTIIENVNTNIDLSEFANGVYYVVIVSDSETTIKKIIKM